MRVLLFLSMFLLSTLTLAHAQWDIQDSHTAANLRGIASIGNGVAWASGTEGTVIRTTDGGKTWQPCSIPKDAENLDFRGIQAIDDKTALIMSSGTGALSRLYKTTDGCRSWKLVFTNPDNDGFWDSLLYDASTKTVFILGDPVTGQFQLFSRVGEHGKFASNWNGRPITASQDEAAFAASNSLLITSGEDGTVSFTTGGSHSEMISGAHGINEGKDTFSRTPLPFAPGPSSGAFSIATASPDGKTKTEHIVVVGGDYKQPDTAMQTAAYSDDWGNTWRSAQNPPHGYRSAVAYDPLTKIFIAVGPNGTDISRDNGRTWTALGTAPEIAGQWNALSLPFVVGPHGRIGKLHSDALRP